MGGTCRLAVERNVWHVKEGVNGPLIVNTIRRDTHTKDRSELCSGYLDVAGQDVGDGA